MAQDTTATTHAQGGTAPSPLHYYEQPPTTDSLHLHPLTLSEPSGVAGEALPYVVGHDNVVTGVLLFCFVIAAISIGFSRNFLWRQLRNFFYEPRSEANIAETSTEVRFLLLLCVQTSVLLALVFQLYTQFAGGPRHMTATPLLPVAIFTAVNLTYFIAKWAVYQVVNHTFFGKRSIARWERSRLFLIAAEGILLFPLMVVQIYFGLPLPTSLLCAVFVVVLVKILTFYKAQTIFFTMSTGFVQNILYLCALELMPLGALWGILNIVQYYLKVNY